MKSIGELLKPAAAFLAKQGVERAPREAEEVIADALGCKRIDLFMRFEEPLTEQQVQQCRDAVCQRAKRVPAAYICGKVDFAGIVLEVTPDVLIPRPETEILVEKIIKQKPQGRLLDLCCGSGAIGLALKARCPELEVTLVDLSEAALAVTRRNAERLGLEVFCLQSDLLTAVSGTFSFMVCNPPYIAEGEYAGLSPEVRCEPKQALIGGVTGYEYYQTLAPLLAGKIEEGVWFEIGTGMGAQLKELFEKEGWRVELSTDYAGHDRYLSLHR